MNTGARGSAEDKYQYFYWKLPCNSNVLKKAEEKLSSEIEVLLHVFNKRRWWKSKCKSSVFHFFILLEKGRQIVIKILIVVIPEGFPGGARAHLPMQETWVPSLGGEDPLEKGMSTHSSILAWEIPWTEEPGGLQSMGLQSQSLLKWLSTHTPEWWDCGWVIFFFFCFPFPVYLCTAH